MNRWNIPGWLEQEVLARDQVCIYCGVRFDEATSRRERPSWEHIVNDERIVTRENIARCCIGCNASKGAKGLSDWLASSYCRRMGIHAHQLAPVAAAALLAGSEDAVHRVGCSGGVGQCRDG